LFFESCPAHAVLPLIRTVVEGAVAMELTFFHLAHNPFSTTPTAEQLLRSRGQQRVLQDIIYGIESRRGITAILGARGMG
jgi:type II secretory pathway predicted ATPase ExeA